LSVSRLGADLVGTRSDYGPFRDRKVPFLFFTTGIHRDYHRPTDLPARLNYEKLARVSRWINDVTRRLADDAAAPAWGPISAPDLGEVEAVQQLFDRILERPVVVPLSEDKQRKLTEARERLTKITGRKVVTPDERAWLVRTARWALVNL